ncbi:murein hydrolase activator EnvC [Kangiella sp. TOML190]|uniref:murein hydrolase activator EnvC family protein n=1 Tax=Kangiella sp. TOML190 TaxID=2931351 RepID=UPI00203B4EBD|nr:peptidoglycan DD-metalloendopeptidase family protein [Kangiella sp. TOML190]
MLLVFTSSSHAFDKKKAEQELKELKQAIQSVQNELNKNRQQQSTTEKSLAKADKALSAATKALTQTNREIKTRQQKLTQLKKEQLRKQQASQAQKRLLANQLRSARRSGSQEYIKFLLNQEDPAKISRMLKYYDYLNKARVEDIRSLQTTLQRLETIETEINQSILELQSLSAQQKSQQAQQRQLKVAQQKALTALKADYSSNSQRLSKLKRNEQELQQLLTQLEQTLKNFSPPQSLSGLAKFKRKLSWPVKGAILHRFGSAKLDSSLRWNGIIIASQEGSQVKAIQHGRVVFSDWLRGFGLLTIIDHGKGYLSLYGHNQALLKNVGDFVEAGEPLATIGQSANFQRSGLYFEIRHNGKPQNPLHWIKR